MREQAESSAAGASTRNCQSAAFAPPKPPLHVAPRSAFPSFATPVEVNEEKETYEATQFSSFEPVPQRSEEHTSELQSLMRTSYAVFCLKTKKKIHSKRK